MELRRLEPDDPRPEFGCGDADLDEFYHVDSNDGGRELLCVTYAIVDDSDIVLAFFSISNDSIKKEDVPRSSFERMLRVLPREKRYSSMPAAKIGRLGVTADAQGTGIGTVVLDFLKVWFVSNNKTGCRFLVVDAYNIPQVLNFYTKNGFSFMTSKDEKDPTRIMYFDLITVAPLVDAQP